MAVLTCIDVCRGRWLHREAFRICGQEGRNTSVGPHERAATRSTPVCPQAVGDIARVGAIASKPRWGTARQLIQGRSHKGILRTTCGTPCGRICCEDGRLRARRSSTATVGGVCWHLFLYHLQTTGRYFVVVKRHHPSLPNAKIKPACTLS